MKQWILTFAVFLLLIPFSFAQEQTGIITGTVVDSLDNLVEGANIQVTCGAVVLSAKSNEFGTFIVTQAPFGQCRVYARIRDAIGFSDVLVESNSPANALVKLDKTIISIPQNNYGGWWSVLAVLVAFAASIAFVRWQKRSSSDIASKPKKIVSTHVADSKSEYSKLQALLPGLSDRERQILEHVIKNSPITQTKLRIETGLPKASLSRNVKKLEFKGILTVHRIGSLSRISVAEQYK